MRSVSAATATAPMRTPLGENLSVDACIVGAGIAGLSTAYLLARAGKSVVVVDDGPIGGGMTQMTSAHLTNMMDDRYSSSSACTAKKGRASRPKATARRPRPLRQSNQRPREPRPLSSAGLRRFAQPMCRDAGPSSARRGCARPFDAAGEEHVGNQSAVATPPECFRTHQRCP
jgi:glycine/D-amino acid oxidase-like deaminating enzyme